MSRSTDRRFRRRLLAATVATLASATAVVVAAWPSEAATLPSTGTAYQLKVAKSGLCIDVPSASTSNKALLQQWGCTTDAAWQQFTLKAVGSYYQLANVNSGKCIDVPDYSTSSGVQLQQYTCVSSQTNQQWKLTASGTGTFQIVNVGSNLCISDKDASTASGAQIVQETCSANTNKQWAFVAAGSGGSSGGGGTGGGATCPCTVAADGTGTYKTVQAAIDAVPANNTSRRTITIKAGTYREIVTIPSNKPYITLQGAGSTSSGVVIVNNHSSAGGYGTAGSATFFANGKEFNASNLTIKNDYGVGSQAVALNLNADKIVLNNVRVLGNQDTLLTNTGRAYVVNSCIEGNTDFIFGGSVAVFHNSTIHNVSSTGGVMTAANTAASQTYGYLFYKCTVNNAGGTNVTTLGRPWGADAQVLYRESTLSAGIKSSAPWQDMSANSWKNARFYSYKNTGAGAASNSNTPQMSDSQAANYTPQKYLAGSDGWNPIV